MDIATAWTKVRDRATDLAVDALVLSAFGFAAAFALTVWAMVTGTRGPWIYALWGALGAFGFLALMLWALVAVRSARRRLAARIRRDRYITGPDRGKWDFIVNTYRAEEELGGFGVELLKELFRIQRLVERWAPKLATVDKHSQGRVAAILKHRELNALSKQAVAYAERVDRILAGYRSGSMTLLESAADFVKAANVSDPEIFRGLRNTLIEETQTPRLLRWLVAEWLVGLPMVRGLSQAFNRAIDRLSITLHGVETVAVDLENGIDGLVASIDRRLEESPAPRT